MLFPSGVIDCPSVRRPRITSNGSAGNVPAHDLDAEAAVLSAVLLAPARLAAVAACIAPRCFYSNSNRRIGETVWALAGEGTAVDVTTVAARLPGGRPA